MSGRMAAATVLALVAAVLVGASAARAMTDEELKQAVEKAKEYMKAHPDGASAAPTATAAARPSEKTAAPAAGKVEEKPVTSPTPRNIPQITLSNGLVNMTVFLPDAQRGYYRGMRFNWSGLIAKAEYAGHTFFGPFRTEFNPMLHDHVAGPADEFDMENPPPGYDEAELGQPFMKIGVGILQKGPDEKYSAFQTFNFVEVGKWKVNNGRDWAQFRQTLAYGKWGYQYTKRITLQEGAGGFVISHTLQNTGTNTIDSLWYCHNFTMIDGQPVGPAYRVRFPFEVQLMDKPVGDVAAAGKDIRIGEVTQDKPIWTLIETGKDKAADRPGHGREHEDGRGPADCRRPAAGPVAVLRRAHGRMPRAVRAHPRRTRREDDLVLHVHVPGARGREGQGPREGRRQVGAVCHADVGRGCPGLHDVQKEARALGPGFVKQGQPPPLCRKSRLESTRYSRLGLPAASGCPAEAGVPSAPGMVAPSRSHRLFQYVP